LLRDRVTAGLPAKPALRRVLLGEGLTARVNIQPNTA